MTEPQQPVLPEPPVFEVGFIDLGPGDTGPDGVLRPPPGPLSITTDPPPVQPVTITAPAPPAPAAASSKTKQASWTDHRFPGTVFTSA